MRRRYRRVRKQPLKGAKLTECTGLRRQNIIVHRRGILLHLAGTRCLTTSPIDTMPTRRPCSTTGMVTEICPTVMRSMMLVIVSFSVQVETFRVIGPADRLTESFGATFGERADNVAFGDDLPTTRRSAPRMSNAPMRFSASIAIGRRKVWRWVRCWQHRGLCRQE